MAKKNRKKKTRKKTGETPLSSTSTATAPSSPAESPSTDIDLEEDDAESEALAANEPLPSAKSADAANEPLPSAKSAEKLAPAALDGLFAGKRTPAKMANRNQKNPASTEDEISISTEPTTVASDTPISTEPTTVALENRTNTKPPEVVPENNTTTAPTEIVVVETTPTEQPPITHETTPTEHTPAALETAVAEQQPLITHETTPTEQPLITHETTPTEQPPAVVETIPIEQPLITHETTPTEHTPAALETAVAEQPPAVVETTPTEQPLITHETTPTEQPPITHETTPTEQPLITHETTPIGQPLITQEMAPTEHTPVTEQPPAVVETTPTEQPLITHETTPTEQPPITHETTPTEQPSVALETAVAEQPLLSQETARSEPAPTEEGMSSLHLAEANEVNGIPVPNLPMASRSLQLNEEALASAEPAVASAGSLPEIEHSNTTTELSRPTTSSNPTESSNLSSEKSDHHTVQPAEYMAVSEPSLQTSASSEEQAMFADLPWLEGSHLTTEQLLQCVQDPRKGVFLFHRRARRRIFLDKVGLNHKHPLPEAPVVTLDRQEFVKLASVEAPDLFVQLDVGNLPNQIILLDQLPGRWLQKTSIEHVLWRYWSWMVQGDLMRQWDALRIDVHELRNLIGHTAFEEVRSFLSRERYLFDPTDDKEVARHLIGHWGMMRYFAPHYRTDLFPSILPDRFDSWLDRKGWPKPETVSAWRPAVSNPIPQHLPIPCPAPWLTWGLSSPTDELAPTNTASPTDAIPPAPSRHVDVASAEKKQPLSPSIPPSRTPLIPPTTSSAKNNKDRYVRQPSWGAFLGLGFLFGGSGIFFYFMQRLALFRTGEVFSLIDSMGGSFYLVAPPVDPYALMAFVWGGWFLLCLAHLFDIQLQWLMFRRWRNDHSWLNSLSQKPEELGLQEKAEELEYARTYCQRTIKILEQPPSGLSDTPSALPVWKELGQALGQALVRGLYSRVWGTLLELYPTEALPITALDRWIARRKLAFYLNSFAYFVEKSWNARHRGHDLAALQAISEALSYYKPFCQEEDRTWRRLQQEQVRLQHQISLVFGEKTPHVASPTGRAVVHTLIALILWSLLLPTYGLFWSVCWGLIFYLSISQLMDLQMAHRGMLRFWRQPIWIHYLRPDEIQEAQQTCRTRAAFLRKAASEPKEQTRPLYQEILLAAGKGIHWWVVARLWGRILSGLLFHWGRTPTVLRFTAQQILRKQVFEFDHHLDWALFAKERGNEVEAAIQLTDAIAYYQPLTHGSDPLLQELYAERGVLITATVDKLTQIHQTRPEYYQDLKQMVVELLDVPLSTSLGRQCAALLKTLQRSYLDKERRFYMTRPLRWMLSFGREPIEQSLEHYGLVRSMLYLRNTLKKLALLPLPDHKRQQWERPLFEVQHALEHRIRELFRPALMSAMNDAGFIPQNHREIVAQRKVCEELLDYVIQAGRFSFSNIRDVVSRNDLRLQDPSWRELFTQDILLRLDEQCEQRFNEIYRESEIYLRGLQRISSWSFGTGLGRFLVKYLLIPFGGSATVLIFLASMIEMVYKFATGLKEYHSPIKGAFPITMLGIAIALVIHTETGRDIFRRILQGLGDMLRGVFVYAPRWVLERPAIQYVLRHPKAAFWYRYALVPLLASLTLFGLLIGLFRVLSLPMTWLEVTILFLLSTGLSYMFFTTAAGRAIWDQMAYHVLAFLQQVKDRWVIGLFLWIMDTFRWMLHLLDYIIYRGDDLLRFHPGESQRAISIKAAGQAIWSSITYMIRLVANLFVEPQVNPIKHFPVVTVSHKMISAATAGLIPWMIAQHYSALMITLASAALQLALPGLCGFLVWEFKENWKLYRANHASTPQPTRVGSHGETMDALLRRGFHSGTLPKLYEKLNAYIQREYLAHDRSKRRKAREQLHHIEESLMAFVERELLATLRQEKVLFHKYPYIGQDHPRLSSNHIDLFFWMQTADSHQKYRWRLRIELEGGWLVGAIHELETPQSPKYHGLQTEQSLIDAALEVFLQKSGIRLMRGKLESWLRFYLRGFEVGVPGTAQSSHWAEYTIHKEEVRVRKTVDGEFDGEVVYKLDEKGRLYEPAPIVTLQSKDEFLPRPSHPLQLSGQYRVADLFHDHPLLAAHHQATHHPPDKTNPEV